jgi:hypothetical protein
VSGVQALRIEPASLAIVDDGFAPGETGRFTAIGTFEDGEPAPASAAGRPCTRAPSASTPARSSA